MIDIVGKRLWFFLISGIIVIVCAVSLGVFGLKTGIDFASGSLLTLKFDQPVVAADIEKAVNELGYSGHVEVDAHGNIVIRTTELTVPQKTEIKEKLTAGFGTLTEKGFENIDPLVARHTARAAAVAAGAAAVCILLYIAFAFRKMPKPLRYGTCAVVALIHNVLVVMGVFSILGVLANWEIDLALVTGILTVIGYAVNDAIVVFDRIRENLRKTPGLDFTTVVNNSLMDTFTRSLITGVGVIFVLVALLLFVGPTIKNLVVVLMVGILTGTYTSVFIAAPLLVVWEKKDWGRLFPKPAPVKKPA